MKCIGYLVDNWAAEEAIKEQLKLLFFLFCFLVGLIYFVAVLMTKSLNLLVFFATQNVIIVKVRIGLVFLLVSLIGVWGGFAITDADFVKREKRWLS